MAFEKVLNTRIINKNADLSSWSTSTLELKQGEIALAKFDAKTVNPLDGSITSTPAYAIKVGQEGKTFAEAAWLYAPASDVHAWAKKSALDYADLPATLKTEIDDLQAAIGDNGSVATAIKNAIEALDVDASTDASGVVISSISETDGKISVTRRALTDADIANLNVAMSKVTGLADALALKADKTTVENTFKNYRTSVDQDAIDATFATKTAVETEFAKYTTTAAQEVIDAAQDAEIAKKADSTQVATDIAAAEGRVDTKLAAYRTSADQDAIDATFATKTALEGVDAKFASYTTTTAQQAIDAEQDRRLGVIEGDYLKAADIANFETKENVKKVADDLAGYKTSNDAALAEVKATAEAARTEDEVNSQIDAKITALDLANTYEPKGAEQNAKNYVDQKFTDANLAQYTTEQEVKDIVDTVITNAVEGDTLTSLTDLVEYLSEHGGEYAELAATVTDHENRLDAIEPKVEGWDATKSTVDANKATWDKAGTALQAADLADYAKTADVVTNEEFTAFEATNTTAIQAAKKAGEDAAAAVAEDLAKYIDGKSMSDADLKKYADDAISTFNTNTVDPIAARVKAIEDAPYATTANVATAKSEAIAAAKEDLEKRDFAGITTADITNWNGKTTMADVEAKGYAVASEVTAEFANYTKTDDLEGELDLTNRFAAKADKSVVDAMYTNAKIDELVAGAKSGAEKTASDALATARTEISAEIDADVKVVADDLAEYVEANDAALAAVKGTADSAVQTVEGAANSGLTASKEGTKVTINFDSECVFVFDCGNHLA